MIFRLMFSVLYHMKKRALIFVITGADFVAREPFIKIKRAVTNMKPSALSAAHINFHGVCNRSLLRILIFLRNWNSLAKYVSVWLYRIYLDPD
jgi:hypothetical protein